MKYMGKNYWNFKNKIPIWLKTKLKHQNHTEISFHFVECSNFSILYYIINRISDMFFSRVLQKDKTTKKTWVCFGNQFIKLPKQNTKKLLDKGKSNNMWQWCVSLHELSVLWLGIETRTFCIVVHHSANQTKVDL